MKIINITEERLKEILNAFEDSKNLPPECRTYKINKKENYFLSILIKRSKNDKIRI